jgi:hypothetical protein
MPGIAPIDGRCPARSPRGNRAGSQDPSAGGVVGLCRRGGGCLRCDRWMAARVNGRWAAEGYWAASAPSHRLPPERRLVAAAVLHSFALVASGCASLLYGISQIRRALPLRLPAGAPCRFPRLLRSGVGGGSCGWGGCLRCDRCMAARANGRWAAHASAARDGSMRKAHGPLAAHGRVRRQ